MITSKQIFAVFEKYLTNKRVNTFRGDRELVIYENPTTSELQDIKRLGNKDHGDTPYIRFIADARPPQKIWVWDAYNGEHLTARSLIGLPSTYSAQTPWLLYGCCDSRGSKMILDDWDNKPSYSYNNLKFYDKFFTYNWNFLDKYMDKREFFDELEKWFNKCKKSQSLTNQKNI